MIVLLHIFSWFWQWNNLENRLIFDEVKVYTKNCAIYFGPKATGNSRSGIPGNSRESRNPKFPAGIPGNFWNSGGNYVDSYEFCLFFLFLLLIMTFYCLIKRTALCTTHDGLTAFWAKPWMTHLTQLFVFIELVYTFKYWYRKSLNSVRISQTQIVIHEWGRWDK